MNSLADFIWAMIAFYFVFMLIWIFIRIFGDIFRRDDLSGAMKVVWIVVLFVLPFLGAMIYLISRPKGVADAETLGATPAAAPQAAPPQAAAASGSTADEIAKLATLRDSGAITSAEFDAAKAKALAV
jgi:Short C-terminal domain/Phospholipase_D-nuclease N-terminal